MKSNNNLDKKKRLEKKAGKIQKFIVERNHKDRCKVRIRKKVNNAV